MFVFLQDFSHATGLPDKTFLTEERWVISVTQLKIPLCSKAILGSEDNTIAFYFVLQDPESFSVAS